MGGKLASEPETGRAARQELRRGGGSVPPMSLLAGKRKWVGGEKG